MDIVFTKQIAELERELRLKQQECDSLKSDLEIVKQENKQLRVRLGDCANVDGFIGSSRSSYILNSVAHN
ncbi:MAG: hypothetical protein GJ680_18430 [Alteromonadaceae bacterium]|nr:hypothetical protein [Alteromonadaceae bacterium]